MPKLALYWRKVVASPPTVSLPGLAEYTSQRAVPVVFNTPAPALLVNGPLPALMTMASPLAALAAALPKLLNDTPRPAVSSTCWPARLAPAARLPAAFSTRTPALAKTGAPICKAAAASTVFSATLPALKAPGASAPLACVKLMLPKPLPTAPPLRAKLPFTVRLPAPLIWPPVRLSAASPTHRRASGCRPTRPRCRRR